MPTKEERKLARVAAAALSQGWVIVWVAFVCCDSCREE